MANVTQYKDANGTVQASQHTNPDGSGNVVAEHEQFAVDFAAGATVGNVVVATNGDAGFMLTQGSGEVDSFATKMDSTNSYSSKTSETVNGNTLKIGGNYDRIEVDASGNTDIQYDARGGSPSLDLQFNADGSAVFNGSAKYVADQQQFTFASGTLTNFNTAGIANPSNGTAFGLTSAANGFSEDISWSAASDKALLNLTNQSTGTTFSSSLGYIYAGDTLKILSNSLIALYDANGHELNSTQIHADGSQTDTNYNADGSVATTYNYDANGNAQTTQHAAVLASAIVTFAPASSALTAAPIAATAQPLVLAAATH